MSCRHKSGWDKLIPLLRLLFCVGIESEVCQLVPGIEKPVDVKPT
jgi:hypothetical protein